MAGKGGATPGAGRKKVKELQMAKDVFTPHVATAVACLIKAAEEGNVKAAEIILNYAYGKPQQSVDLSSKEGLKVVIDYEGNPPQTRE